ncbi:MAG: superoxide dismutase [Gloeobacteraceae cyanobacterium ES-bin-316]|nr:superoxide dismutase [Ferruginibacter sp.]
MKKESENSRRKFLINSALGTASVTLGIAGLGSFAEGCSAPAKLISSAFSTGFDQLPLPYSYAELEDVIDAKTMEIHYSKHAAAYSKALKEAVEAEAKMESCVENILAKISKYSVKMRNNAGGHYNHEMLWKCMRAKSSSNKPGGKLLGEIEKEFGSFENFKTQMSDAATKRFGSGWAWLYVNKNKKLAIGSTPNQDNPLMDLSEAKGFPILGLDVWEHAYYLKYQNKRAEYISNWWSVVNWDYVAARYESAI